MLVLTRKAGECIMIDDDIEVKVIRQSGGQVYIGIHAPARIKVHRREVWERIRNGQARNDSNILDDKSTRSDELAAPKRRAEVSDNQDAHVDLPKDA